MHARLERLLMGSHFAGVEAEILPDGVVYHFVLLKRSGNKMTIEKTGSGLRSPQEVQEQIGKMTPVVVVLTGKGIIHRVVAADPDAPLPVLLSKVLPNAVSTEFSVAAILSAGHNHVVSVIRTSVARGMCEEAASKLSVISCRLGPAVVQEIYSLLDDRNDNLQCGNHRLLFAVDKIAGIEYTDLQEQNPDYKIGGEPVPAHTLVAFAAAFSGMMNGETAGIAALPGGREEFLQRGLFRSGLKASLAGVLVVLLVNYFFFSHYWSKQSDMEIELQQQGNVIAELNEMNQLVESKTVFLNETGLLNRSSYAWCADQLAHGMPRGIQLTRMNFSPRIKIPKEDSIAFGYGHLEISGRCEESLVLNEWLQRLKTEKWIRNVSIQSYVQGQAVSTGEFKLDIELE